MARLVWGAQGERYFETGVDRGVLYVNNQGHAWPGLVSISESPTGGEARPFYLDGIKYVNVAAAEEFEATIEAFSSPAAFSDCDGTKSIHNGLFATQQARKQFNLSYRSRVGNDVDGADHAYKIHLVYNALAAPSERSYSTISDSAEAEPLSWAITTLPPKLNGLKPTAHFVIDSRYTPRVILSEVEDILYGRTGSVARIPTIDELRPIFASFFGVQLVEVTPGVYEAYEADLEMGTARMQATEPEATDQPFLWLDTSAGSYAVPRLVTGG